MPPQYYTHADAVANGWPWPMQGAYTPRDIDLPPWEVPPSRLRGSLLTTTQLDQLPPLEPVIKDLFSFNTTNWIAGEPGSYKSFLAIDMACSVAAGLPCQGWRTTKSHALYVTGEGKAGLRSRVRAWEETNQVQADNVHWLTTAVNVNHPEWAELVTIVKELDARFVVLDTQSRMTSGLDENSAEAMGGYVQGVSEVMDATGACVITLHHTAKMGTYPLRGHGVLSGAADTIVGLVVRKPQWPDTVQVRCAKQKDLPGFDDMWLRAAPVGDSVSLMGTQCPSGWDAAR